MSTTKERCKVSRLGQLFIVLTLVSLSHAAGGRVTFPDDMQEVIQMVHDNCVGNTGVSEEDIKNCEKGIFADDKKLKCYMFCILEEASFVDDDGTIDYDMLLSMIPEPWRDKMGKMIDDCKHLDVPGKDNCEKSMEIHQCLYKSDSETYFLF